jgi:hypothetical protein
MPHSDPEQAPRKPQPAPHKTSFLYTLRAVAWSFIGLRRTRDFDRDVHGLNPVHVIIAGLIGVAIFIGVLLLVVKLVVP